MRIKYRHLFEPPSASSHHVIGGERTTRRRGQWLAAQRQPHRRARSTGTNALFALSLVTARSDNRTSISSRSARVYRYRCARAREDRFLINCSQVLEPTFHLRLGQHQHHLPLSLTFRPPPFLRLPVLWTLRAPSVLPLPFLRTGNARPHACVHISSSRAGRRIHL